MTQSLPPVCSGVPAPSQHGFFAAQLFLRGASPTAERGTWSALPCPAQSLQEHLAPSQGRGTHNSLLECNQFLLLLLSSFKVAVNESLELHEVLVLTLFLNILGAREKFLPLLASLRPTYSKGHLLPGPYSCCLPEAQSDLVWTCHDQDNALPVEESRP